MTKRADRTPPIGPLLSFLGIPFFADWGSTWWGFRHGLIEANPLWTDTSIWVLLGVKFAIFPIIILAIMFLWRGFPKIGKTACFGVYTIFSLVTIQNLYLVNTL